MGDYVKLNVDATYDPDSLQGAARDVLRHHNGKFTAAMNGRSEVCFDAFHG